MDSSPVPPPYTVFVGIDVAATSATYAWMRAGSTPAKPTTIAQTVHGYTDLEHHLRTLGGAPASILIVLEATGTYWITLATTLAAAGFAISVVNPAQAHAFAKALLKRAKTDAIDAQTLTQLAALLQPAPWTPPPAIYTELHQRLVQRAALVGVRTQLRNQLHALLQHPTVIASVQLRQELMIQTVTDQIRLIEAELTAVIQQDEAWAHAVARLESISGIGILTACWILVTTLNFTLCRTPDEVTGYAGLAPNAYQSGTSVHKRACLGHTGNGQLRRAVYLATLSATRCNPVIKAFYTRLRAAGKPMKVARCAAARKLLQIAWAVVTKDRDFDPTYAERGQLLVDAG